MTCGPVLIQWLLALGFEAYGSVLLASVPPASMYMNPTFPAAGAVCETQACAHSSAAGSMHMGVGPGTSGLVGMQVKALVPLRSVRILPSASMATMVAWLPTFGGAADSALAMSSASVGAALAGAGAGASAAHAAHASGIKAAPISTQVNRVCLLICTLPLWSCGRDVVSALKRCCCPTSAGVNFGPSDQASPAKPLA